MTGEQVTSRSQRALKELVDDGRRNDPERLAVLEVLSRQQVHSYKTGRATPMGDTVGKIHAATNGRVPADGWVPDGGEGSATSEAPCSPS